MGRKRSDLTLSEVMERLRAGDAEAARAVFHRYARGLIDLARSQLAEWIRPKVDPEDIVQSVYRSFFARCGQEQVEVVDWSSLWGLLALITVRKCVNQSEFYQAARRNGRKERSLAAKATEAPWELLAREPTPLQAAVLTDTVEQLLRGMKNRDRDILVLQLQGYTVAEISAQVGRSERTVARRLEEVREHLRRLDREGDLR